ncbi:MAG: hypothetical protein GXP14_07455 [Gammaproteobacteria bacterium]|nr:hypothetical protein [Gammaproteobacteria bacterium]
MYCWTYGVTWPDDDFNQALKPLYSGKDEGMAVNIAKENQHKFSKTVVKSLGTGCIYRYVNKHQS